MAGETIQFEDCDPDVIAGNIKGISLDSRGIKSGYLFAALKGTRFDGNDFIQQSMINGASHILVQKGTDISNTVISGENKNPVIIESENPRRAMSILASRFYKHQPPVVAAVTGTNGKTSVAYFVKQLWENCGYCSASIGTLGISSKSVNISGSHTTPDPVKLHSSLADLASAGITHAVLEASSHGLNQYRLDGVKIKSAGFTNITRDHLDYHGDEEKYFQAKARLFSEVLCDDGCAVINADSPKFNALKAIIENRGLFLCDYGVNAKLLKISNIKPHTGGYVFNLCIGGVDYEVQLPLAGDFQVMNVVCALGLIIGDDTENHERNQQLIQAVSGLNGAKGRLQLVENNFRNASVYIDYAHTPDALENILLSLRSHVRGRLICLFGCGGDRDKGKRPMMGKIASDLSDLVIVSDDNPRSEDPAVIRSEILTTAFDAVDIGDRSEAIKYAVSILREGDVLVVAGKGHEQGQIVGNKVIHFDDAEEIKKAVEQLE